LETSALTETGNILFCAFVDAITRLICQPLMPSVPIFTKNCRSDAVQAALASPTTEGDSVLVCKTGFHCDRQALDWHVVFTPTPALYQEMATAVEPYIERR
jgi:chemotaxis protein CheC